MTVKSKLNTIIADDSKAYIQGMKHLISEFPQLELVDICFNGKELVESKVLNQADLLLIDIDMPVMNGIDAARTVNFRFPHIKMIALTMHQDNAFLNDFITVGFKAFIHKPDVSQRLGEVVDKVMLDKFDFPNNLRLK